MWLNKQVIMLPTNEKANIGDLGLSINNNVLNFAKNSDWVHIYNPIKQHLYIVSDEEIKEGDWFILNNCNPIQCIMKDFPRAKDVKKIIATTDKSITIDGYDSSDEDAIVKCYLPQLSQEFIELYCKRYNKGNPITEVEIEYQVGLSADEDIQGNLIPEVYLKIKNNEVTVKEVQVDYSHNLLSNMQYYMEYCLENGYVTPIEWLNSHKHYKDTKELKTYTEEEIIDLIKFMKTYNGLSTNTTPEFIFKQWKTK